MNTRLPNTALRPVRLGRNPEPIGFARRVWTGDRWRWEAYDRHARRIIAGPGMTTYRTQSDAVAVIQRDRDHLPLTDPPDAPAPASRPLHLDHS